MSRAAPLVLVVAALACTPRQPAPAADASSVPCTPASGPLAADASAAALRGTYRLDLVASRGVRAGDSTSAELELVAAADSLQAPPPMGALRDTTTRLPLIGWTSLQPDAIGASDTGPLDGHEPTAPGVLAIERRTRQPDAPREILLRLGAEANRRDRVRFDGGYFVLTVQRIDDQGFAGTWASAAGASAAGGHFCARKAG
jgi:hypothetical protein